MIIPSAALPPQTLRGVVEEFITREGTDYGEVNYSLEEKVLQVMGQIERNEVLIEYDPDTSTCHLRTNTQQSTSEVAGAGDGVEAKQSDD